MNRQKKKLNPIPLSLRDKKRYIEFELESEKALDEKEVKAGIWEHLLKLFGEIGCAEAKFWVVSFDSRQKKGILRCSVDSLEKGKAGLLLLKEISKKPVFVGISGVSGTIKGVKD